MRSIGFEQNILPSFALSSILALGSRHTWGMKIMKATPGEFERLIYLIAQDECQASFKKLFVLLHPKIYHYCLQAGLDKGQALELCQEVLLKIWSKAKTFDHTKGDLKTWVFTIVRNSRFDFLRKKRNDPLALSSQTIYSWQEEFEDGDIPLMEELYQNKELMSKIELLPDEQKQAILCVYAEGQTHTEYSQEHNIPLGTVKSRIRLAINSLRKEMDK